MKKLFRFAIVLYLCILSHHSFGQKTGGWPAITNEMKPWTRWWWMGSSVDEQNLSKALQLYSKAGLGGMELTPIYGVKGLEAQFIPFTSVKWMNLLAYTLSQAKKLNLGVDMAMTSGWPFGGPWVTPEDACKYIEFKTYYVPTGGSLKEKIEFVEKPLVRAVSKNVPIEKLKDPIASNDSLYIYAFDQVKFPRQLPLVVLMAYSNSGEIIDLTEKVSNDGVLNWQASNKEWTLIAGFSAWHGKQVERAGPGAEGDVIDHFSLQAITNYLNHFDESFKGHDISGLRAFFNDSYEVDDAQGESFYTRDFFSEFEKRRGYDLKKYLPALTGKAMDEEHLRVLCDYRETISDLLLEKFTIPWQQWAAKKGKIIRNQSHGSPANILDLYAASDIPETEGSDILNIKFATSAAHVCGKKLVSAEAATWLNEHFLGNLSQTKENVDRFLIGGVNHIFYHGTPYSPETEEWPGRLFYASEHFAPTNPLWKDFPALNTYIARVQSFIQKNKADNDFLIYFPIHDQWMQKGKSWLVHFYGADKNSNTYTLSSELLAKGYTYDFISDKQIGNLSFSDGNLISEGKAAYKTILIPKVTYIPLQTFQKLVSLAESGATIIFMSQLPSNVPGLGNLMSKRAGLEKSKETLNLVSNTNEIKEYSAGKGKVMVGEDVNKVFELSGIKRETLVDKKLHFLRLSDNDSKTYFITNWSGKTIDSWVPFQTQAKTVLRYNPMTGGIGNLKSRISENGEQLVRVQLKNGESGIFQFWNQAVKIQDYISWQKDSNQLVINSKWQITFIDGGPKLPDPVSDIELSSWEKLNESTKIFSGSAIYSCNFSIPETACDGWELSLGEVYESASVKLNGKELGSLIGPDFSLIIDKNLIKKNNTLEVRVSNLMANRIIYMDKNNIPYRKFYNTNFNAKFKENMGSDGKFSAKNWEPKKSGLVGPVILKPLIRD